MKYDSRFARQVLEDMKKVAAMPHVRLDMGTFFSGSVDGHCAVCAAGAYALVTCGIKDTGEYGARGMRDRDFRRIQNDIDFLRLGGFEWMNTWHIPLPVHGAYSDAMRRLDDSAPERFWQAWENFVSAYEAYELGATPTVAEPADSGLAEPLDSLADENISQPKEEAQEEAPTFIQSHLDYLELRGEGILEDAEAPVCDGSKSLEEAGITRNGGER